MRRVVSIWLPTWPTDRLRRRPGAALPADKPVVTSLHDGHRHVVGATNTEARTLGLHAGMPLAHAQAMIPNLCAEPADLERATQGHSGSWRLGACALRR